MIASEKRHNTNAMDASFSSYQERLALKLMKNKVEDDELGIFGAEKYFTGAIDEDLRRFKNEEPCPAPKPKTPKTPSVRSESSWNSRRGLLVSNGSDHRKKSCVRSLLATLRCNCNDKASVKITDNKLHVKELPTKQFFKSGDLKPKSLSSRWTDKDVHGNTFEFNELKMKREDYFTFPVLADRKAEDERRYSSEVFGSPVLEKGRRSFSLERKLTMLNWDGVTPIIDISRNGGHNHTGSDASSDLFEIESFSTNENNIRLENNEGRSSNGYAPSEVSIDWSVVTAGADLSTAEDFKVSRTVKGSGILSGCKSHKAVRVSGDEHCNMTGGGEKAAAAAAMAVPTRREWCHRLDSVTAVAKIQADTKLSDSNRGFGTGRSVPRMHASQHLYIQQ